MKMNSVPPQVAKAGLRMVKSICLETNQELTHLQMQFIAGVQKYLLNTDFSLEDLEPITPDELLSLVQEEEFRFRIIRGGIIASCIEGEMKVEAAKSLETYAKKLQIDMAPVETALKLAHHNLLMARIDIARKSLPGVKVRQTIERQGLWAMIKQFFPLAEIELPEVIARYKELEHYPEGTLGKEFVNYLHRNHFPFPGEKGAGPEIIVLHDCLHILGDYGTSAPEEIEVASFQAGCQSEDPIYGILFGLAQYHLDIRVAPVAPSQSKQADPQKMIAAFARGCKVNRDMWRDFDPWQNFSKDVATLRKELGIETQLR